MTRQTHVPDGVSESEALERTTHMGIVAHPDDLEILGYHGILECFGRADRWFCGVVATDGAGASRSGPYAGMSDLALGEIRRGEQRKAAAIGGYGSVVLLGHTSADVKATNRRRLTQELGELLRACRPQVVYTHDLADRHDTHVAVGLATVEACRALPAEVRPRRLLGGAVWRSLDWLVGSDRVALDVAARENLAASLIGVFDSQITGGKRHDLAVLGRRRAQATYHESHGADETTALDLAMDLTPLIDDPTLDPAAFVQERIERLAADVRDRIARVGTGEPKGTA